jgi:hypothetical protein
MPKGVKTCPKCGTIVGCRTYICSNEECNYSFASIKQLQKKSQVKSKLAVTRKDTPDKEVLTLDHPLLVPAVLSRVAAAIEHAEDKYTDIRYLIRAMSKYEIPDESINFVLKSKVEDLWAMRMKSLKT